MILSALSANMALMILKKFNLKSNVCYNLAFKTRVEMDVLERLSFYSRQRSRRILNIAIPSGLNSLLDDFIVEYCEYFKENVCD